MSNKTFAELGVDANFLKSLTRMGYTKPSPIQAQAVPHLLNGEDLLGIAQTGTGKTAAFALPILQQLHDHDRRAEPKRPRGLVLAPTRELASQIENEIAQICQYTKLKRVVIFGGVNQNPQVKALAKGVDIVVATPGRLLDLMQQRHIDLSQISHLVLDEADRLLDMGFIRDVKRIVAQTPARRQTLMFSATMPKEVNALAKEILNRPARVDVSPKQITVKQIDQRVVMVENQDKLRLLDNMLRHESVTRAIVFTRTKHGANKVARKLANAGIGTEAFHGNKTQNARQRSLENFKDGDAWVLVATDIAARGIDIEGVSHVFNYELPHEPESYVHRIGRTGRAGATGVAWSLVDPSERSRLRAVERLIKHSPTVVDLQIPPRPTVQDEKNGVDSGTSRQSGSYNDKSAAGKSKRRRNRQNRGRQPVVDNKTQAGGRTPRRRKQQAA